jgi:anti-sigma regulatory factor (Ser/Thr protein kinase)
LENRAVTGLLSLRNEAAELGRLAAFAEEFARRHALPAQERVRLLLILEELFTNAVVHGYEGSPSAGHIEVVLSLAAGRLTIEFSDDGRPFEPLSGRLPDLAQPAAVRPIGGLGLHIVRSLAEEAHYVREAGRNRLVLTRRLAAEDPG